MNSNTRSLDSSDELAALAAAVDRLVAQDLRRLADGVRADRVLVLRRLVDRLEGQWLKELADRCVVVNGVAKTYAMTGWRIGWMIGPPDVVRAAINLQSHATSNVANVSQAAALAAVSGDLVAAGEMRAAFDRRRRRMLELLRAIPGVSCVEPEGAFYCFPSLEGVLGRELRGQRPATSMELVDLILEEAKVAIVPGEAFGAPGYARLSYALGDDDLVEGVTRIAKLLAESRPA